MTEPIPLRCSHPAAYRAGFKPGGVLSHERCLACDAVRYVRGPGKFWPWHGLNQSMPARRLEEWHEEDGAVLCWKFPIEEPPYVGTPLDDDFPDYVTHWTALAVPEEP